IHGRLLTAWSTAGILGPVLVNYLREYQIAHGVERAAVYDITMMILAGLLVLGFICNLLVRPVNAKHFMTDAQLDAQRHAVAAKSLTPSVTAPETSLEWKAHPGSAVAVVLAWAAVGLPLGWGVWITLQKAAVLFS
ncbi:MAG: OFA family MFS transporter, partial [Betaproteobacteria bacterium]|nr:OFA family MFS transporter [Betaproteobacteria bacterium]